MVRAGEQRKPVWKPGTSLLLHSVWVADLPANTGQLGEASPGCPGPVPTPGGGFHVRRPRAVLPWRLYPGWSPSLSHLWGSDSLSLLLLAWFMFPWSLVWAAAAIVSYQLFHSPSVVCTLTSPCSHRPFEAQIQPCYFPLLQSSRVFPVPSRFFLSIFGFVGSHLRPVGSSLQCGFL